MEVFSCAVRYEGCLGGGCGCKIDIIGQSRLGFLHPLAKSFPCLRFLDLCTNGLPFSVLDRGGPPFFMFEVDLLFPLLACGELHTLCVKLYGKRYIDGLIQICKDMP